MADELILVLGATGKTGRRVVERLRAARIPVRAVSRSSPAPFDWDDPAGWDDTLHGVRAVYVIPPEEEGPVHEFVRRAEAAGVEKLVLLSGRGADTWGESGFGLGMLSAEEAVRASALDWTIVRSSNFAQNFDEENFYEPIIAGELALPAGDVPEPFIDIEDVADVIVAVLTRPGHEGRTYELSGPRALTFREATQKIAEATGRTISYSEIPSSEYEKRLVAQGFDSGAAHALTEMFVMMRRGLIASTTTDVHAVLGRAPATFESYVTRVAATGAWTPTIDQE